MAGEGLLLLLRAGRGLAGTRALSGLAARWQRDGFVQPVEVVGEEGMVETQELLARLEGEAERGQLPGQFDNLHFKHPAIAELCTQVGTSRLTRVMILSILQPGLLDTVSDLLGPDLVLLSSSVFAKYKISLHL